MASLFKLLVFLMVAPLLLCIAGQLALAFVGALLPWLILGGVITGAAAGLTAGLLMRRRLSPSQGESLLPPGAPPLGHYRVRRPRGRGSAR